MKVYIEKTRDQERIVYTQMRATLHACSQNKAKPLASIYIAFYLVWYIFRFSWHLFLGARGSHV